jgi:putative ABC transport system permease protein
MAGDPIPQKSAQLFVPQIDNWDPTKSANSQSSDHLEPQLSYTDAVGLMNAHAGRRQTAMYSTGMALTPENTQLKPFQVHGRAAYADFFAMFDVPFRFGAPWSAADDAAHADVVVITKELNDKLFGGAQSIGKTVNLDDREYRVVGVIDPWNPLPLFYDLNSNEKFGKGEDVFLPFSRAIESAVTPMGNTSCRDAPPSGWEGMLHSECIWTQFWVELPTAADVAHYRAFLNNYAAEQQRSGRFHWPPHTQLRDVRQWLVYQHVVSDEVRILVLVSFSFLFVCLLNAMGLLLAKIMGRAGEIGVRRALGASRAAIFIQCLIEAGVLGLAGGLLGLVLTLLGLLGLRSLLSESIAELTHISPADVGIAIGLAVVATMVAGLYPIWRAVQVQPAWQLKSQ